MQRRHLLTTFGAGIGQLSTRTGSDHSGYAARNAVCGVVRFTFAYAITDHWSLGFHYDRLGTEGLTVITDKVRFTTYQLEATWRPWIGKSGAIETNFALGISRMALTPRMAELPLRMDSGVITIGGRYVAMLSDVLGAYIALDQTFSGAGDLTNKGEPVIGSDNLPIQLNWNAQRISAGMVVRF